MKISIFWFRRDLRIEDNAGLYLALKHASSPVCPLFIFDKEILDDLDGHQDRRVTFIHKAIRDLQHQLADLGSGIMVRYGRPMEVWQDLLASFDISEVYTNRDYEPYAKQRDAQVERLLDLHGVPLITAKDHMLLEVGEVMKADGEPYHVFTPYKRRWLQELNSKKEPNGSLTYLKSFPTNDYVGHLWRTNHWSTVGLSQMGFQENDCRFPSDQIDEQLIASYDRHRDYPADQGTTRLGVHLRFGTISIRALARKAIQLNETFLSELIWRDFYSQILAFFPRVVNEPFRRKYAHIPWRDAPREFELWCLGLTGYPLVDAGMHELNQTGYMHNRVRMVVASFLTKHLLIDWRRGEAYFASKLLDYDLASNNGGWQWAAGCGTDAAPYFRIFNPTTQMEKFDPKLRYVRKWIPTYGSSAFPDPIVDHAFARARCLRVFKQALSQV